MSKHRGLWSEDEPKEPMAAIGERMSVNRVFNEFSIPGSILHSYMKVGESRKK
jgi:hypothetical protein